MQSPVSVYQQNYWDYPPSIIHLYSFSSLFIWIYPNNKLTIKWDVFLIRNVHQKVFFYFRWQHLLKYHEKRCLTVRDLPWALFYVISWISDRVTPHSLHHPLACQYTGLYLYQSPISSVPGSLYLLLRSGMPVITALSTQINSIQIFISPRPQPGSLLALTSQEDVAHIFAF